LPLPFGPYNQKVVYKLQSYADPGSELNFYVAQNIKQAKRAAREKKHRPI
jgi:hypothetical protein